jgi:hypothetical protein
MPGMSPSSSRQGVSVAASAAARRIESGDDDDERCDARQRAEVYPIPISIAAKHCGKEMASMLDRPRWEHSRVKGCFRDEYTPSVDDVRRCKGRRSNISAALLLSRCRALVS